MILEKKERNGIGWDVPLRFLCHSVFVIHSRRAVTC